MDYGKWQFLSGEKNREFKNFAKTQGNLYVQVVNSLILKIKDIVLFSARFFNFCKTEIFHHVETKWSSTNVCIHDIFYIDHYNRSL